MGLIRWQSKHPVSRLYSRIGKSATRAARLVTARWRTLPNTLIVGAQKSGTSSLFDYLAQHPQILTSSVKEVHYFDGGLSSRTDNFVKGESWYRSFFPLKYKKSRNKKIIEASPLYLFSPDVARRIRETLPQAKIIVVLRNPVDRAISHYHHEVRAGRESRQMLQAFIEEESLLAPIWANREFRNEAFITKSYLSRGLYADQIERYLKEFSKERICIIKSNDLFADPDSAIKPVLKFLGLKSDFVIPNKNARNVGIAKGKIDKAVTDYLLSYFESHNRRLFELLRMELNW
jgi:hypothetical protein